jgi:hypothetical protein
MVSPAGPLMDGLPAHEEENRWSPGTILFSSVSKSPLRPRSVDANQTVALVSDKNSLDAIDGTVRKSVHKEPRWWST